MSGVGRDMIDQARELDALLGPLVHQLLQNEEQVCCHDITLSEYRALRLAAQRRPPAMQDIVEAIGLTKSGATRLIDRLEEKGYARRERTALDGRVCCVQLTSEGERLLDRIDQESLARTKDLLAAIEPSARDAVIESLRLLERAIRRAPGA